MCVFFTSVKRAFTGYITCLEDFMHDPRRAEPLIGMFFLFFKFYAFEVVTKWLSFEIKGGILVSFSVNVFNNLPISYHFHFSVLHGGLLNC